MEVSSSKSAGKVRITDLGDSSSESEVPFFTIGDAVAGSDRDELLSDEDGSTSSARPVQVIIQPLSELFLEDVREIPGENTVAKVLKESRNGRAKSDLKYRVRLKSGYVEQLSYDQLHTLENGVEALEDFQNGLNLETSEDDIMVVETRRKRKRTARPSLKTWDEVDLSDDSDQKLRSEPPRKATRRIRLASPSDSDMNSVQDSSEDDEEVEEDSESDSPKPRRSRRAKNAPQVQQTRGPQRRGRKPRTESRPKLRLSDSEESVESNSDYGFNRPGQRKRKPLKFGYRIMATQGTRRSGRVRDHHDMRELGEDDPLTPDSDFGFIHTGVSTKVSGAKEIFKPLPRGDPFRERHMQSCEVCGHSHNSAGVFVYCQGCSLAYHKNCLGHRGGREHLVTKVGEDDFVLQCRRCINFPRRKDVTAPDHARCQDCKMPGRSCAAFKDRKTAIQEQRERDDNNGVDPVTDISPYLLNNPSSVLFRCIKCWRAFHFEHLPPRTQYSSTMDGGYTDEERGETRYQEYAHDWKCRYCLQMGSKKVSTIVAWRPVDVETYLPGTSVEHVEDDEKEYLIKWENCSYFQVAWMPGAWVWGVCPHISRTAFAKKNPTLKLTTESAVPEEFLRIDVVLDVKYTNIIDIRTDEIDRARIREVDKALIKYKGLGYDDAVWETVPDPDDGDRWTDFVTAYNDWVLGRYTHIPKFHAMKQRLEKVRKKKFVNLEKSSQPDNMTGGQLMKYQLDGLNWIYHQWHSMRNGILADEMGLGKTIQVIAFLAMMVEDHNCFPFLVVVPNSTCANWRREIKKWAPNLRVVTYFGSSIARQMALEYELYPGNAKDRKDLRCHVVVTSYDAITSDDLKSSKFFKGVSWQGLIVDEGQRLKNDKGLLHSTLAGFKVPFRLLLTGTPLQNNARELFNLLQFLDDSINASQMEEEFSEMSREKIMKLHDLIRPYILRRTKAQVLTFLPAMAQIILPVTMSHLQKKLYKSILAKSPELLRALFASTTMKLQERASLNNILMQLRKCLCHPFVYSQHIEERNLQALVLHRNLVEASSKLHLLELLLPKLKARGHRVLLFSQFLDMLDIVEDFLDGLEMKYQRLDGTIDSLEKQKRIDEFNAANSQLFALLLSTRAGGVGINLATADTVIILDPDFNPHQDIQALSRAHRIGQTKKVLCFQLMTRGSAEEKIVQIGRKKMALDHVVVEQLDVEDFEDKDVESILRHGAAALFNDEEDKDIKYDDASIELLLDRSQIENTQSGQDNTAESQFSFARVWANSEEKLQDNLETEEYEKPPDPSLWEKIIKDRERAAAEEAAARAVVLGRGKRQRAAVDYAHRRKASQDHGISSDEDDEQAPEKENEAPADKASLPKHRRRVLNDSDTDFRAESDDGDNDEDNDAGQLEQEQLRLGDVAPSPKQPVQPATSYIAPLQTVVTSTPPKGPYKPKVKQPKIAPIWKRVQVAEIAIPEDDTRLFTLIDGQRIPAYQDRSIGNILPEWPKCQACTKYHPVGSCPLKVAGVELCPLCALPHYGYARICPHIKSETMVRLMLDTLKNSSEPRYLVDAATKYLRGVKGHLVHSKKKAREAAEIARNGGFVALPLGIQPQNEMVSNGQIPPRPNNGIPSGFTPVNANRTGPPAANPAGFRNLSPDEDVEERLLAVFQNAT